MHRFIIAALLVGVLLTVSGCKSNAVESSEDIVARGAELDRALNDAYLQRDWRALSSMVAPDYYGVTREIEWDYAKLEREFSKIHLTEFHLEKQHVKRLGPDQIMVNDIFTMRETYGGQDTSVRGVSSLIWIRRGGRWLLLVEQVFPLS